MAGVKRSRENPLIIPDSTLAWEAEAAFNPSVVKGLDGKYHMLFRACGARTTVDGADVEVSSIGYAAGTSPVDFDGEHVELMHPTEHWERFGCEAPRVTFFEGRYYIFYTAVSDFSADGIKVAVAITKDFKT